MTVDRLPPDPTDLDAASTWAAMNGADVEAAGYIDSLVSEVLNLRLVVGCMCADLDWHRDQLHKLIDGDRAVTVDRLPEDARAESELLDDVRRVARQAIRTPELEACSLCGRDFDDGDVVTLHVAKDESRHWLCDDCEDPSVVAADPHPAPVERVDLVARAMYEGNSAEVLTWSNQDEDVREWYREFARSAARVAADLPHDPRQQKTGESPSVPDLPPGQ